MTRPDLPSLLGVIALGGVAGPLLLLVGLDRVSGTAGALLLNLEAPLTIVLAAVLFGEHLGRRAALATVCILLGAVVLRVTPGEVVIDGLGVAAIAGWSTTTHTSRTCTTDTSTDDLRPRSARSRD